MSDNSSSEVIIFVFLFFASSIVLWLVFREIVCWYWKINERIELFESILKELKNINDNKKQDEQK